MTQGLDWALDGRDWPHREQSRFVTAAGLTWHTQQWDGPPHAPVALLLHGTGAATHSWRDLAPLMARDFRVLTLDLPGHAFTSLPPGGSAAPQFTLPGMAQAVSELLEQLQLQPDLVVGHSAGAAVAVRLALDRRLTPQLLVGLNAALLPLRGLAGQLFSPVARVMASSSWVPRFFASRASDPAVAQRLLDSTGSRLDARGTALYARLVGNAGHAQGALSMMANWDLQTLAADLTRLQTPLDLVIGLNDHPVPPAQAERVLARLPPALHASCSRLPRLGHLAHEEQPEEVARLLLSLFAVRARGSDATGGA